MSSSKDTKRKIKELCGFDKLPREAQILRAREILDSSELKQAICSRILGISHRDVEKAMLSIINSKKGGTSQKDTASLLEMLPEKFDYEFEFAINRPKEEKKAASSYRTYTMEEVQMLIEASRTPVGHRYTERRVRYPPMPRELAEKLVEEYLEYRSRTNTGSK